MLNKNLSYLQRAEFAKHPIAKKLLQLMAAKQTNLALSADVIHAKELLTLADNIGPEICVLKTHIDIIEDFTPELTKQLKQLSKQHNFLLFEDRKFADIGNTVQLQYRAGIYRIAEWADIINAHSLPGPGIIQGLKNNPQCGLLLLAEMSSQGNLFSQAYTETTVKMAQQHKDCVIGFITQHKLCEDPELINFTPGIGVNKKSDQLGQGYIEPQQAIVENGADVIIVGRGLYQAPSPKQAAQQFRELGWDAYSELIK